MQGNASCVVLASKLQLGDWFCEPAVLGYRADLCDQGDFSTLFLPVCGL